MAETGGASKLLVVEDEKNVGLTLVERLKKENFQVTWATTAAQAWLKSIGKDSIWLLLDVGLPDGSGFAVADHLRKGSARDRDHFSHRFRKSRRSRAGT